MSTNEPSNALREKMDEMVGVEQREAPEKAEQPPGRKVRRRDHVHHVTCPKRVPTVVV
jgi:hypothetical protein